jgi:tetratricopeptide (TPR) repeat protein
MRHSNVRFLPVILFPAAAYLFSIGPLLSPWPAAEEPSASAIELNNVGVGCMNRFLYREAAEEFRKALAMDPGFSLARINLGIALFYNQELDAAQQALEEALSRDPSNPYANFSLGLVLKNKGLTAQAEVHFKRVIDFDPKCAAAFYHLGVIHARQGRANEAEAALRHALELDPSNAAALYNLGSLLVKLGRAREGHEFFERFRALQPGAEISSGMGSGPQYGKAGKYALVRDGRSDTPRH